jgi:hypothetical protein
MWHPCRAITNPLKPLTEMFYQDGFSGLDGEKCALPSSHHKTAHICKREFAEGNFFSLVFRIVDVKPTFVSP